MCSFLLLVVWRYKRQYIDKNTNIEIIYVYASERSERGKLMHFYISNLLYKMSVSAPPGAKIAQYLDEIVKF